MKTIHYTATLFYYDGPQIFEARDIIGGHYVALLIPPQGGQDRYLVVGVTPEQLRQFRSGMLDLRSLLIAAGKEEWYITIMGTNLNQPVVLAIQSTPIAESTFLPDEGFVLHDHPTDEFALREARERNNLILEISADPPEAAEEHRIRLNTLIGLLGHVQGLIKYAFRSVLRDLSKHNRSGINVADAGLMDVVIPAASGSFRFVLEAVTKPDMFGHNDHLYRALQRVDMLFENTALPQETLDRVKMHRGHFAGAYLRLLKFLVQHQTGMRYSWAQPDFAKSNSGSISKLEADSLVNVLSNVTNMGNEEIILVGRFDKFNRKANTWGLFTEDGGFSGTVREGGPSLDGLTVGARYKFFCVEEIVVIEGTGRESHTLYLDEHEPA